MSARAKQHFRLPSGIAILVRLTACWLGISASIATAQIITTVAGGGVGDGGPATNASVMPMAATFDANGNLYIADFGNGRVRKMGTDGAITTIAGGGLASFSDGLPATSAQLGGVFAVAFDGNGNLYIADSLNRSVRKVDKQGVITTFAGAGSSSGDTGSTVKAPLNGPTSLAVDAAGNVYIADGVVRKVDTSGKITTFAGGGHGGDGGLATDAFLIKAQGVTVDAGGNVYIADSGDNRVRKVDTAGIISTIAGDATQGFAGDGGPATSAKLSSPQSVSFDANGNLYISDYFNGRVRKVDKAGNITTVAGGGSGGPVKDGGPATDQSLAPTGVTFDRGGNMYIADGYNLLKVDTNGIIRNVAGNGFAFEAGDGGLAINAKIGFPSKIAFDGSGNFYFADNMHNRIRKVDASGRILAVAGNGDGAEGFGGGYSGDGGKATNAKLYAPSSVAVDRGGNLYIADSLNLRIRKVDKAGTITTFAGNGSFAYSGDGGAATSASFVGPGALAFDSEGNLFVSDEVSTDNFSVSVIRKIDTRGVITTVAGTGPIGFSKDGGAAIASALGSTSGIAFDSVGNLYFAESLNGRVRKIDKGGILTTIAGNGTQGYAGDGGQATSAQLYIPVDVAFDSKGNLYIAESFASRVRRVDTKGLITTVAGVGTGAFDYSGDGAPATIAWFHGINGVALDSNDNLYISDSRNIRIRKVATNTQAGAVMLDQRGLTGTWYNPATSGQGLVIQTYPDLNGPGKGVLAAGWYTFDMTAPGGQRWYTLQGPIGADASSVLNIYAPTDGIFAAPPIVRGSQVGYATLTFTDCMHGSLGFVFNDGSGRAGTIPLNRLDANLTCTASGDNRSADYLSDAWYDPLTSGQGFFVDNNPESKVLFIGWYTYAPLSMQAKGGASQRWYTIQAGNIAVGASSADNLPIYETIGGTFNAPGGTSSAQVGTASVRFQSCSQGTLSYTFTGGTNAGLTGSVNLSRLGPTPVGCVL